MRSVKYDFIGDYHSAARVQADGISRENHVSGLQHGTELKSWHQSNSLSAVLSTLPDCGPDEKVWKLL